VVGFLGLLLSFVGAYLAFYMTQQPKILTRLVKQKTETILKEKELSEAIINSLPGIFYLYNTKGQFYEWNENFKNVSGYSDEEISLMHPREFFDEPERAYLESRIKDTFENGQSHAETYFFTKDKRKIYYYFTGKTINYNGELCLLGTGIDLSKRKEAEEELKRSEEQMISIFNNAIDTVIVMDIEGIITHWNPKAEQTFGWTSEEAVGSLLSDMIIPEQHREHHKNGMERYKRTGVGNVINKTIEISAINKQGKEFEISLGISSAFLRGKVFFIGFISDISVRKEAERQKEFERRDKEALINSTNDMIWSVSKDFKLIAANESFLKSYENYTSIEITIGDDVLQKTEVHDNDFLKYWEELYSKAFNGQSYTIETIVPETENSDIKYIETSFNPIYFNNIIEGIACYSRDVTQSRVYQKEITEYNKKLKTAQKIANMGYWELDLIKNQLFWSEQVYAIWGVDKNNYEVNFDNFIKSIHNDDLNTFNIHYEKTFNDLEPVDFEHRITLPDGTIKWVHELGNIIYNSDKKPIRLEGTVQDITQQKLAILELEEQNHFITTALENLPIGIAVNKIDDGTATLMNKTFADIYGWPEKELTNLESFFEKVYPDPIYRKQIKDQIISDLQSAEPNRMNWEGVKITTKKGKQRIINAKNIPLYDQNLMISSVLDVTEKALAEEQLLISNERYEYVTKATYDAIWDWDFKTGHLYWGDGFKTIFGYKNIDKTINSWEKNIHPDDAERVLKGINAAINGSKKSWTDEYRFKKGDGTYAFVKDKGVILRNIDRKATRMIGAIQDITKQKEYEQHILDINTKLRNLSDHLQTAREEERIFIAREIHDELGQQLTGIKLDVAWLKNKAEIYYPEGKERTERLIESINATINKVRKIATNLRPSVLDDLGLEAAIEWHFQQFKEQSELECHFTAAQLNHNYGKAINTAVYRIFQEALTNINRHANATVVEVNLFEEHNHLVLEVKDNGKGISDVEKNNNKSLGITGMKERAIILDGEFSINQIENGGTIVRVSIPL
jgi:two-component system CheB/CheR fusion protein